MAAQPGHSGWVSRLNAWLLNHGSDRYNEMVDSRKKELLADLEGTVLEIGPGTGANLSYYPANVKLIGLEPNPYMQEYLRKQASDAGRDMDIMTGVAEHIPLPDESVDAVVSTLVLCSVGNLEKSLAEIHRVLRPGGTFLFLEHVAAPEKSWLRKLQNLITPCWRWMADGCHPNRETWKAIQDSPFEEVNLERLKVRLPVVSPHITGRAVKSP